MKFRELVNGVQRIDVLSPKEFELTISKGKSNNLNICPENVLEAFTADCVWLEARISGGKCTRFTLHCEGCIGLNRFASQTFELKVDDYTKLINMKTPSSSLGSQSSQSF